MFDLGDKCNLRNDIRAGLTSCGIIVGTVQCTLVNFER
jgi:hypothetical protein